MSVWGWMCPPPEENADLINCTPEPAHLLLKGVSGYFLYHNDGLHLYGGVMYDAIWKRHWQWLAAQSDSWYDMPYGAVGRRFTAILAAEWRGILERTWNSKRPLVFAHVVFTETLGVCRARKIRAWITRRMDLWERGLHVGLVGDFEAEEASREGRSSSRGE